MRRYAKLSPRMWTGALGDAMRGDDAMLAMAPYLLGPHCNMIGLYRLPLSYAAEDLGWSQAKAKSTMHKLVVAGYCAYDDNSRTVWVLEALRHELGDKPLQDSDNRRKAIVSALCGMEQSPHCKPLAERYEIDWKPLARPLQDPSPQESRKAVTRKAGKQESRTQNPVPRADVEIPKPLAVDGFPKKWAEWLDYRKAKRQPVSERAERAQLKKLSEFGPAVAIQAIDASIANDWQGLFPDKITTAHRISIPATDWSNVDGTHV